MKKTLLQVYGLQELLRDGEERKWWKSLSYERVINLNWTFDRENNYWFKDQNPYSSSWYVSECGTD